MQVIISHENTDFDALASIIAAQKLYPKAKTVISQRQSIPVRQFLNIYRDKFNLIYDDEVDWDLVTKVILVDVANVNRTGSSLKKLQNEDIQFVVFDHHPPREDDIKTENSYIAEVGAAVTLLIEKIKEKNISLNQLEATLFGLGIYTDTGFLSYDYTTTRDLEAVQFLMEQGMDLSIIRRFATAILSNEEQELLNNLLQNIQSEYKEGLHIVVTTDEIDYFQNGLANLTTKVLEITDADVVVSAVRMRNRIHLVGRARTNRVSLQTFFKKWQGGGHEKAGSAIVKSKDTQSIAKKVLDDLLFIIKPAITAQQMMTSPVKTITPETTIEKAGKLMYRYGHSGFPVVENDMLVGMITRRDLEKANHHGLGHAPVKGYMTTNILTISPKTTEEEIQDLIIKHNVGRLPVLEEGKLLGIVSRTDVIQSLHGKRNFHFSNGNKSTKFKMNVKKKMQEVFPKEIYQLLENLSTTATKTKEHIYLIGGIVRDLLLRRENDDIDIVVEGNGVRFAKQLHEDYGGDLVVHESFGTATWIHPSGLEIDIATSRLEFYDRPAALPDVEQSTLQEDLLRRDFTINAMAIDLSDQYFGELIDPFNGKEDLENKQMIILHNLSFIEDPTRIFRGIRFENRFHFKMDQQTEHLALQSIHKVNELSIQRIVSEMKKIFAEVDPKRAIQRLFELHFWQQFSIDHSFLEKSLTHLQNLSSTVKLFEEKYDFNIELDWFSYFSIPFIQAKKQKALQQFAQSRTHKKLLSEINKLEEKLNNIKFLENIEVLHKNFKNYSVESLLLTLANLPKDKGEKVVDYIVKRHQLSLLLSGQDLIEAGLKPGEQFAQILFDLEVAQLNRKVQTKEEALEWLKNKEK